MTRRWATAGIVGGRDPRGWYELERIDDATFAVHEPRYWQRSTGYLLIGAERALVFDTGPGLSDLPSVVGALTDRPVTALASHLHWDHIGGHARFARVAAPDLPAVRRRTVGSVLRTTASTALTPRPRRFRVTEWVRPGGSIDLGGRLLDVHHAPGHTPDSIVLHDRERGLLLTGDLLYDGPLAFGLLPGSRLSDARRTVQRLAGAVRPALVLGGHYGPLPGDRLPALADALAAVEDGAVRARGRVVRRYEVGGFRLLVRGGGG